MPKIKTLGALQPITIGFTKAQYAALLRLSRKEDRSLSHLVREAVLLLLASRGEQVPDEAQVA